jgi:hypothetical protein
MATSRPISLGATGLTLSGLALVLWKRANQSAPSASVPLTGITLRELGNSLYEFDGLPDPQPSEDYSLSIALAGSPSAIINTYDYGWTKPVDLPSLVANTPGGFQFDQVPMAIKHGSTTPPAFGHIWGLTADPTGAAVAFALTPLGGGSAIALTGAARVTFIDRYGSPALWHMMVEFDWAAGDTDPSLLPAGLYIGTFTVTLPGGSGTVVSPNNQGRVSVS